MSRAAAPFKVVKCYRWKGVWRIFDTHADKLLDEKFDTRWAARAHADERKKAA